MTPNLAVGIIPRSYVSNTLLVQYGFRGLRKVEDILAGIQDKCSHWTTANGELCDTVKECEYDVSGIHHDLEKSEVCTRPLTWCPISASHGLRTVGHHIPHVLEICRRY